jgi:hypothetical protein
MEPLPESANPGWPFPFTPQAWAQTPPAVPAYLRTVRDALGQLQERVETLEAWLQQNSTTSHRLPSSDSPYKKPCPRPPATTPRKAGGKPGHLGHRQALFSPTTVRELRPEWCACGNTTLALSTPYYTHQVLSRRLFSRRCLQAGRLACAGWQDGRCERGRWRTGGVPGGRGRRERTAGSASGWAVRGHSTGVRWLVEKPV